MAKLLKLTAAVRLPDGATGGKVSIEYSRPYLVAAKLAGGHNRGLAVLLPGLNPERWATFKALDGTSDLTVYGAEVGDIMPPAVTVKITPLGPVVDGTPIIITGVPADLDGDGEWDFESINAGAATIVTPEQLATFSGLLTSGNALLPQMQQALADTNARLASLGTFAESLNYILGLGNLTELLSQLALITDLQLDREGWAIGIDGSARTLRATVGNSPLELVQNSDGSVTVRGDPLVFGVRVNADQSQTLYRRSA